ncbi:RNA polymerase sigma factor [Paraburkholderia sp. BL21I4N1]|uniref:RNA polymerase sigma factor n=1 Tax=Paraburkholderia sp. BL21I4N1 TaxID=1938801 RepID=UPI000CFCBA7A|nr:RNA polymerase sigma factor [Paraburkholderia sp. BL21I4N1]PQV50926.1 RNA polymerase sigma-70 factor (ECF subfamily) [Paraburkholderia sp. BL21I4N1]
MVQTDSDAARAHGDADSDAAADAARSRRFQQLALPHLDAAYNLARWLCGNASDADDVVQEAFMRAFRFFDTFRGDTARPWLLAIVRRTWYTEWRRRASSHETVEFDDSMDDTAFDGWSVGGADPQALLIRDEDTKRVHEALALLPVEYREVLILRELEEMGYREIAIVADVPIGTVMSRLARGRRKLAALLKAAPGGGKAGAGSGARSAGAPGNASGSGNAPDAGSGAGLANASGTASATASATITPLRASANGRPLNNPGGNAGHAQETPDGL